MATDLRIARRYARALFSAAMDGKIVKAVEEELHSIVDLLANHAQYHAFMFAPYASREEKLGLMTKLYSDRVTGLTMQFIRLALSKQREGELGAIAAEYTRMRRESDQIVFASITSAVALDDDQKNRLITALEKRLSKRVESDFHVDPATIGGIRVAYENNVLDGTLRGSLSKLREKLRYDLLKQA